MSSLFSRKHILAAVAAGSLVVFSGVFAKQATAPTTSTELVPSRIQTRTAISTLDILDAMHYERRTIDTALSAKIFDRYFKDLDAQRAFFLADDLKEFEAYRDTLGDNLKKGNLRPAFVIYNRYQQRAAERFNFVLKELAKGTDKIDFTIKESIELDREKSPWISTRAELDDLWRKRIKAAVLGMRLSGKTNADIQKTLTRRYKNQLSNLYRAKTDDAFQLFMNSFTETYDPHTEYFTPRTEENFNINMSLQLEGIGAVLQSSDDYTKVVRLVPAGPADKGGQLKPGDRIVAVAQGQKEFVDVLGWRIDEVVDKIRGPKNTTVRLQIIPATSTDENQTRIISIVRNTVKLEDQAAQKKVVTVNHNGEALKIGVIKLPAFYADFQGMQAGDPNYRSTTRDVKRLINELKTEKVQGLVLDLRNNGGGSLTEANSLVGLFISTGPTVQIKNANGKVEVMGDSNPSVTYSGPLLVMVNRLSASAAEIFAGAIQDYGRGLVVGSTTFGKGTVQSLRDLEYGQLKLTEAKFYRISGASTQNRGVNADILFPNVFDESEIGESSLQNALPWDTIPSARYLPYQDFSKRLPDLRKRSEARQAADPDFIYLNETIALANELKNQKTLSLNEAIRRQEKKDQDGRHLAIENRRRAAKGEALLKSWNEMEKKAEAEAEEAPDPNNEKPEDTAFILEASHILADSMRSPLAKR